MKKRILLVNLLPTQFQAISKEFGTVYDLKLWDGERESTNRLRALACNAHRIYGMTDFMSHSQEEVIMRTNKKAYRRFSGGVSTLKSIMRQSS